ncbi:MAG: hypothetical protein QOG20_405 [Pseudonocardiales bacterium]|nr:hypothetical protein [Pseudonocardiales bacterium]
MNVARHAEGRHSVPAELRSTLFEADPAECHLDFAAIQRTPEFRALRRKQRNFVFPMSLLFMLWFMAYVLLSAYARQFMAIKVLGLINVGIVMGLAQFLTTVVIMALYCSYADKTLGAAVEDVHLRAGTES